MEQLLKRRMEADVGEHYLYGVKIDLTNPSVKFAITYTDQAVDFSPAVGGAGLAGLNSWNERWPFNSFRPCLVKNGEVVGYLKVNDYSKFKDGTNADITSGAGGDVMIEMPLVYYKIYKEGTNLYVKITNDANMTSEGFVNYAFMQNGVMKDKLYISAYCLTENPPTKSLSGATNNKKFLNDTILNAIRNKGAGYDAMNFFQLTYIQVLYLILFRGLNSQLFVGNGFTNAVPSVTGSMDSRGLYVGDCGYYNKEVKCFGMESLWGRAPKIITGVTIKDGYYFVKDVLPQNLLDAYNANSPKNVFSNVSGYVDDVVGDNVLGFLPTSFTGSSSTYFADLSSINGTDNCVLLHGGSSDSNTKAGLFAVNLNYKSNEGNSGGLYRLALLK